MTKLVFNLTKRTTSVLTKFLCHVTLETPLPVRPSKLNNVKNNFT